MWFFLIVFTKSYEVDYCIGYYGDFVWEKKSEGREGKKKGKEVL